MQVNDRIKEIRTIKASEILPNPKNWRTHPEEQKNAMMGAFAEIGNIDVLKCVETEKGLMLIDGHLRTDILGDNEIKVAILDLTVDEANKALATFDPIAMSAKADEEKLKSLLDEIEFESNAIDEMLEGLDLTVGFGGGVKDGLTDPDEVPEVPEEPTVKPGELWLLGDHRLLCGDSTNIQHVERLMGGKKWRSMVTSPPYNQGESNGNLMHTKGLGVGKKNASLYQDKNSDNRTPEEYFDFCMSIFNASFTSRDQDDHSVCWNVAYNSKSRDDYGKIIFSDKNPYRVKETIVWDKSHSINLPQVGIYSRRCEFVFVLSSNEKYRTSQKYNDCRWNYWQIKSAGSQITGESVEHRAAFPVDFALKMISDFSVKDDIVYEPFCGSGTTLIASEQIGRMCFCMEISPKYCDVIIKRWEDFTGNKAELAE